MCGHAVAVHLEYLNRYGSSRAYSSPAYRARDKSRKAGQEGPFEWRTMPFVRGVFDGGSAGSR